MCSMPSASTRRLADGREAATWLQAERITDVLLVRADLFAHTTLADLVELPDTAQVPAHG